MLLAANLILRFVLECCGLAAAAYWGFAALDGWPLRIVGGNRSAGGDGRRVGRLPHTQ